MDRKQFINIFVFITSNKIFLAHPQGKNEGAILSSDSYQACKASPHLL